MENIPTITWVVALALRRPDGHLLMQRRPRGKAHAGLWEFPGGKIESGETPRTALVREIAEELGIAVSEADLAPAGFADDPSTLSDRRIVILLYTCSVWTGEPNALEGGTIEWVGPEAIAAMECPPLDNVLLGQLGLLPSCP